MTVYLFRWPPASWPFQEILAAAVQPFSNEKRPFDSSKSSCKQLMDRIKRSDWKTVAPRLPDFLKRQLAGGRETNDLSLRTHYFLG